MTMLGPNVLNTIEVSDRLPLMENSDSAQHFTKGLGFHAVFVPSSQGGRLRIGFKGKKEDTAKKSLAVMDPHGVFHTRDSSGEVRIDIEVLKRGTGLFSVAVADNDGDYKLYALYEEIGSAQEKDGSFLIPWNFWYFPFADSMKEKTAWGGTELQPIQKYERAFGRTDVMAWELENHADPLKVLPDWWGHCHLSAPASILFENPGSVDFKGETFLPEELKYYAAEFFGRFGQLYNEWVLPEKTPGKRDGPLQETKPSDDPELFGTAPLGLVGFLRAIRRALRMEHRALVIDLRSHKSHKQVWNQAVFHYETRYWQEDMRDPTLVRGTCVLLANEDDWGGATSTGFPAKVVTRHGKKQIQYISIDVCDLSVNEFTVRFSGAGHLDSGASENRWHSSKHNGHDCFAPRFANKVGKLLSKPDAHGNPHIERDDVLKLLRLRSKFE